MTPLADPALGSAPGWPLVLYFHHVNPLVRHYTSLDPDDFRRGLENVLQHMGPALEPADVGPDFRPPDEPRVLFTFDDGYRDTLTLAAPVLAEFDVRVLLFCTTERLDRASVTTPQERAALPPRESYLDWAEAGRLAADGHVLSAHTRTHPRLTELDPASAEHEVEGSLQDVAERTGHPARSFAYPYGLVPEVNPVPSTVLGFGTVKSLPASWTARPLEIRRTYLPVGETDRWPAMAAEWREQWYGSRC
ncbi:peptidoglycan/xylan/chitin deacetylase (PgdA/CDA1 family) [Streptomyces sp. B4I13]|uniref:polysaccharide deacetylase family protein n=1 Tax=Streptomyces sp. B4I13 TaxID=3042271 RepID=UPI002785F262|nr:polysaccharide deacetylase family protein [Streptomyces sp. B4I13]MDQ0959140.1 peptidoglycan/xylan/chitin deacetylase (PgdA/CDA1 family) [Streptomyces sp. B4I13]